MSKKAVALIIIGLLVLIAVITNPEKDDHISKLEEFVISQVDIFGNENSDMKQGVKQILRHLIRTSYLEALLKNNVIYNNWVVFSTTNEIIEGKETILGVGVFGNIYFLNANYISNELKNMHSKIR